METLLRDLQPVGLKKKNNKTRSLRLGAQIQQE